MSQKILIAFLYDEALSAFEWAMESGLDKSVIYGYCRIADRGHNIDKVIIFCVRLYQKIPHPNVCMFEPSCSNYMILAVEKYGGVRGFFKGILRIVRCNPFSEGGVDYP